MYNRKRCCFCGKEINNLNSNDPSPACLEQNATCCTECNFNIVLPSRVIINEIVHAYTHGREIKYVVVPDFSAVRDIVLKIQDGLCE